MTKPRAQIFQNASSQHRAAQKQNPTHKAQQSWMQKWTQTSRQPTRKRRNQKHDWRTTFSTFLQTFTLRHQVFVRARAGPQRWTSTTQRNWSCRNIQLLVPKVWKGYRADTDTVQLHTDNAYSRVTKKKHSTASNGNQVTTTERQAPRVLGSSLRREGSSRATPKKKTG